jgi:hypothetical protein
MQGLCTHERTELIARRGGVDYVSCKDCGQVFEADDIEALPASIDADEEQEV